MTEFNCPSPNCGINGLKKSIDKIDEKQDKLIELAVDIKYLREEISEVKITETREHNEIYTRLRGMEGEGHHKDIYKSLSDMEKGKLGKKDVIAVITVMSVIFTIINIVLRFTVK